MNDRVLPETARRLADVGFPQPEPAPGQWWSIAAELVYVSASRPNYFTVVRFLTGARPLVDEYFDKGDFNGLVFLPSATDILRELERSSMFWDERTRGFSISTTSNVNLIGWTTTNNANPAEAAAAAYLELYKKN